MNKRWDNRVLPQQQKQPTTLSTQLEEPLAQWELDQLNQPISTPSSDERPVIDWRPKDDFDYDYKDQSHEEVCVVCWLEESIHEFELQQRHDPQHEFEAATPAEIEQQAREVALLESMFTN